ncbi:hypothetical protein SGPA1_11275 [Streptomyces misionensis JCM 4497]
MSGWGICAGQHDCQWSGAGWTHGQLSTSGPRRLLSRDPRLVHGGVLRAHRGPGGRVAGHPGGLGRAGGRADGLRQDAGRVPGRPGPAGLGPAPGRPQEALPGAVRLTAQGARGRRRAQSAQPADRYPPGVRPAGAARARDQGRHPLRRHPGRRAPRPVHPPAGHPDHHPRVALPDAHLGHPRRAHGRGDRDPGRGARGRGHQARRAPRALPGAPRRTAAEARPADRPVGDRAPGGRGGALPLAAPQGGDRPAGVRQGVRPLGGRPGRGHGRTGRLPRHRRGRGRRAAVDLAAGRGADRRPGAVAPLHHRLRQLPAPGRAAVQPAQRDRVRARDRRAADRAPRAGPADGRLGRGPGRAPGDRPRPPRLGVQGAARAGRGGPEGGPTARGGRHLQPGAGHRHGRGRSRRPGGVPALGRLRAPARGPRRAPGGRRLHRCGLPQVPRRSGAGGGGHRADAHGRHRVPEGAREPAGRARPAACGDDGAGHLAVRRPAGPGAPRGPVRLPPRVGVHGGPGHARRALSVGRVRRTAPPGGVGPGGRHHHRPARRPAAGRHLRWHHPGPGPVRGLPRRQRPQEGRRPGRRAGRGDGLRVPCGRRLHTGHQFLAHRGHHPRPGAGLTRAGRAGPAAVLEGRPAGPSPRTGPRGRRVPARGRLTAQGRRPAAAAHRGPGRVGGGQRAVLPGGTARGLRPCTGRPHDRGGALP